MLNTSTVSADLKKYASTSKEGLRYIFTEDTIHISNKFGDRIAELHLCYCNEKIFGDAWIGYITTEEYKEIMSGPYLDIFIKTACTKKICNTQLLKIGMDAQTSEWFIEYLLPKMLMAGLQYNALIIPTEIYAQQSMEYFEQNLQNNLGRLFPSVETALLWLRNVD